MTPRRDRGIPLGQVGPDHSALSYIRNRLPLEVHQQGFVWILVLAAWKKLLQGQTVVADKGHQTNEQLTNLPEHTPLAHLHRKRSQAVLALSHGA